MTTTTLDELRELGLLERSHTDDQAEKDSHEITMAGKIWLLRNK
jgi:hypothetical protein